jgi:hypothetical protein
MQMEKIHVVLHSNVMEHAVNKLLKKKCIHMYLHTYVHTYIHLMDSKACYKDCRMWNKS